MARCCGKNGTNSPGNGDDVVLTPHSLAIGPGGTVAVTGFSDNDYATIVYPRDSVDRTDFYGRSIRFAGVPGRSYNIERAVAITGGWSTIGTVTAPLHGVIEYVDATPRTSSAFYRTVSAP
jgi:hypothetical protein